MRSLSSCCYADIEVRLPSIRLCSCEVIVGSYFLAQAKPEVDNRAAKRFVYGQVGKARVHVAHLAPFTSGFPRFHASQSSYKLTKQYP
jgi:hypothetical protein